MQIYHRKITHSYNKLVKPRVFQEEDLVLKVAYPAMKGLHALKFTLKWEGPYEIDKFRPTGYYIMKDLDTGKILPPTNLNFVKKILYLGT